jgi:hypothetical protein
MLPLAPLKTSGICPVTGTRANAHLGPARPLRRNANQPKSGHFRPAKRRRGSLKTQAIQGVHSSKSAVEKKMAPLYRFTHSAVLPRRLRYKLRRELVELAGDAQQPRALGELSLVWQRN